jgi:hypothetical protein
MSNSSFNLSNFFSKPIVGITGSFASIISLILAIYFYSANQQNRSLTFYQHPVEASVLKTDQTSKINVTIDGKEIDSDITAVQVAVWNQGNLPIKRSDILKDIKIKLPSEFEVLETRIVKISREVTNLKLDRSILKNGEIGLDWKILEKNDGGVIQVVYAGPQNINLEFAGIIQGQDQLNIISYPNDIKTPIEQYKAQNNEMKLIGFSFLGMGAIMFFLVISMKRKESKMNEKFSNIDPNYVSKSSQLFDRVEKIYGWIFIPILIGASIYLLFFKTVTGPPFGF